MWQITFLLFLVGCQKAVLRDQPNQTLNWKIDAGHSGRLISPNLFGIFFEEINHAGDGGLWAELVDNRGFEAGGPNTPSNIAPWYPIGSEDQVWLETERSSCFKQNPIALRIEFLCDENSNECGKGVGVANPGYWGMDIQAGKGYHVVFWLHSSGPVDLIVAFTSKDGQVTLAQKRLILSESSARDWTKQELYLEANGTDHYAMLSITSSKKGTIWLDQVSALPLETYKGHGFQVRLAKMLEDLKPKFVRFPGGSYVEGERLQNAWRWRESVGPWEERPGHFGDVWGYWSDDGIGYFEFLQLAEDLGALPVWVFNTGISFTDEVTDTLIGPFVQDILEGIEFARGDITTQWGQIRADMGHPDPFQLHYIAVGNGDCGRTYYRGNYLAFYNAIKASYPDMKLITNCDGLWGQLDHPSDLYDVHIYTNANDLFSKAHMFDHVTREGPKAFVSEFAVTGQDAGKGSLLAALAEGAFMIGLELNRFNPDVIVFNSWQQYGTPSYWVQHFFKDSSGATLLPFSFESLNSTVPLITSALRVHSENPPSDYLILKAVNFGGDPLALEVLLEGINSNSFDISQSTITILSANNVMDENSFSEPNKVVPKVRPIRSLGSNLGAVLPAYSVVSLKLHLASSHAEI
ncbi:hypothetical protein O6H91_10G064800 [Diphasiastrum complanatum]|uniref:Uncharacterized protein n=1 Tax=Diphasiastrum complanatum TaxID=34168 RepID=A0ACC2CI31_DIPCM|nr:hypothetical protein O6H91_10G064800 [Diphasiastrum complanatum]